MPRGYYRAVMESAIAALMRDGAVRGGTPNKVVHTLALQRLGVADDPPYGLKSVETARKARAAVACRGGARDWLVL